MKKPLSVEPWPTDRPVGYARNPRQIPQSAIDKVAASIKEFGWRQPIVVDDEGVVLAGHVRLAAAKKLGLDTVPVHVASELTPEQARAYRLADNRAAQETAWDDEMLSLELHELDSAGFDLGLTGFDLGEINGFLDDAGGHGRSEGSSDAISENGDGSLSDRFGIPPFSVLNAREGWWQGRKRAWVALGIQSELGRGNAQKRKLEAEGGGESDHQRLGTPKAS